MLDKLNLLPWFRRYSDALSGFAQPKPAPSRTKQTEQAKNGSHHAVSIHSYGDACSAAKALADRRFLSAEAPRLPLKACDASQCRCKYVHHDDRRAETRRVIDTGDTGRIDVRQRRSFDRRMEDDQKPRTSYFDHTGKNGQPH